MHPVDEFAALKAEIRRLETRAAALRDLFLERGAPPGSNRHEIVVRRQTRRVLVTGRLPDAILDNPRYWELRTSHLVTLRSRDAAGPERHAAPVQPGFPGLDGDDLVLVE